MLVADLGLIPYTDAWQIQERCHAQALQGHEESLLLLEHPPVITFGRRSADSASHLLASADMLREMGVEVVQSDRGGDITFHGPGQLVAYPILRLADRQLSPAGYVHRLEDVVIATLADFGIESFKDPAAPGVWVNQVKSERGNGRGEPTSNPAPPRIAPQLIDRNAITPASSAPTPVVPNPSAPPALPHHNLAKICALGVRIRRGVSLHGIALNLTTNLNFFALINPCGLSRPVTTIATLLGPRTPTMQDLKNQFAKRLAEIMTPQGQ